MATVPTTNLTRMTGGQQGQAVDPTTLVDAPDLSLPLINEPAQKNPPADIMGVGPLQHLIGTWTNQNIAGTLAGGTENPYSYNLMVLPQVADAADPSQSPYGYILKSQSYYEEITFSPIHGSAANRGGDGSQISNALLYEQRVYISNGPAEDMLVHFENGIWGFLSPMPQALGPYGNGNMPGLGNTMFGSAPSPAPFNIFKQISVPHGNSVLACGNIAVDANGNPTPTPGAPTIGAPPQVLPVGINTDIYTQYGVQNLNPAYAQNPNLPLAEAVTANQASAKDKITEFIQLDVSSAQGGGMVSNINFEQQVADVTQYSATYWIENTGDGFNQLQYSQTIMLRIPIMLAGDVDKPTDVYFPHITTNTLTKVPGTGVTG